MFIKTKQNKTPPPKQKNNKQTIKLTINQQTNKKKIQKNRQAKKKIRKEKKQQNKTQKYFFTNWYWHKSSSKQEWVILIFFSKCITLTWRLRNTCINHLIPWSVYCLYFDDWKGACSAIYNNNCCVIFKTTFHRIYHTEEDNNDTGKISLTYNKERNSSNHLPIVKP